VSTAPAVSVVVPTHNRRDTVVSTVRAMFDQRGVALEVVVVDDGSADGTFEALQALEDPRVRVVRHERALGQARARDAGVAAAQGEWVAFLDDDDQWSPDKLRLQLDAVTAADADFVYCTAVTADVHGKVFDYLTAPTPETLYRYIRAANVIPAGSSNVMARAALLARVGGFDPELTHLADWDVWIRLTEAGRAAVCPEPLVAYILHDTNIHLDQSTIATEARHLRAKHVRSTLPGDLDFAALDGWSGWAHQRRGHSFKAAHYYLRAAVRGRRKQYLPAVVSALLQHLGLRNPTVREIAPPEWLAQRPAHRPDEPVELSA
jgi:glycosyltransferase involved in cell wall biosynthesis